MRVAFFNEDKNNTMPPMLCTCGKHSICEIIVNDISRGFFCERCFLELYKAVGLIKAYMEVDKNAGHR